MLPHVRHAVRALLREPAPTGIAVLALAIGIGATVTTFTFVNATILHPFPYPDQDRLFSVWETLPHDRASRMSLAPANYLDYKAAVRSFESLAAYRSAPLNLTGEGDAQRLNSYAVSPEFFTVLGMPARLGRTLSAADYAGAGQPVVVVSHGFWQKYLAGDPQAVGRSVSLSGQAYTVVGVMPSGFDFPLTCELWKPLVFTPEEQRERKLHSLLVFGRLGAGISDATATAELNTVASRLAERFPESNRGWAATTTTLVAGFSEMSQRFVLVLFAAAGFVLLLAVANVANLQLARAASRQKEIAIRTALGGTRRHIARQFLTENLILAAVAGVLGLLLGAWALDLWRSLIPVAVYRWVPGIRNLRVDPYVVAFTCGMAVLSGILSCLVPILHIKPQPNEELKAGGRSVPSGHNVLRRLLVVGEVAFATVLLVGAVLMVRAFHRMSETYAGVMPERVLTFRVGLPFPEYAEAGRVLAFERSALEKIRSLPGALSAASVAGIGLADTFTVAGRPAPGKGEPLPSAFAVSAEYFRSVALPILNGRPIGEEDREGAPRVAVLSESVARHYFREMNPIGREIRIAAGAPAARVIGVAGDEKSWFTGDPMPRVYVSLRQSPPSGLSFVVRKAESAGGMTAEVRGAIAAVDRAVPVFDIQTYREILDDQSSGVRLSARMMSGFATIALLLAAAGIYAVIAYSVARRTQEIGVRMALGADSGTVLGMVVGDALRLALFGLLAGVPLAFALERFTSSVLAQSSPLNGPLYAGLAAGLLLVALLAGYIPARRACSVDPMSALRQE